jgi:hypothetical protein
MGQCTFIVLRYDVNSEIILIRLVVTIFDL